MYIEEVYGRTYVETRRKYMRIYVHTLRIIVSMEYVHVAYNHCWHVSWTTVVVHNKQQFTEHPNIAYIKTTNYPGWQSSIYLFLTA